MPNIVQFLDEKGTKKVGVVDEDHLWELKNIGSTYELVTLALKEGKSLKKLIQSLTSSIQVDYNEVIEKGRLLPPVDHPNPYHFWITGTGLTHLGSANARDSMHKVKSGEITDTIRMFQLGLEAGKPINNKPGVQPEWFYKGNGLSVIRPGASLISPFFADSGSEESEICTFHYIDKQGQPCRIGYALGNEFSDHVMEKKNYLYLAHSKVRLSSFGPELYIGELPADIRGKVAVKREGKTIWEKAFLSGEDNMCHNISNLEYHHFKYEMFRKPGDLHAHYFGTATLSFSDQVEIQDNDVFEIEAKPFGKPLINSFQRGKEEVVVINKHLIEN